MFRCNHPTIIAHGPSVMPAGSIQLVSPCLLVPRAELGVSRVPITTALVVATAGDSTVSFATTPEAVPAGLVAAAVVVAWGGEAVPSTTAPKHCRPSWQH